MFYFNYVIFDVIYFLYVLQKYCHNSNDFICEELSEHNECTLYALREKGGVCQFILRVHRAHKVSFFVVIYLNMVFCLVFIVSFLMSLFMQIYCND